MSLTIKEEKQFFAHRPNRTRITMGGKALKLVNMPKDIQEKVKKRLAEKDEVMAKGQAGILPGIKIDGKQVTRDNIKDFELKPKKEVKKKEVKGKKYTKKELSELDFKELKVIGKKLGTTDRSKFNLIKEILKLQ